MIVVVVGERTKRKYFVDTGRRLGSGIEGDVFATTDGKHAVKVMNGDIAPDLAESHRSQWYNRAALGPNVAIIQELAGPDLRHVIMDLVPGVPLDTLLEDRRTDPLPLATLYEIAREICRTIVLLTETSDPNYTHADVKPSAFMVLLSRTDEVLKVTLSDTTTLVANLVRLADGSVVTPKLTVQGTDGYICPEVLERRAAPPERRQAYATVETLYGLLHDGRHSTDNLRVLDSVENATKRRSHTKYTAPADCPLNRPCALDELFERYYLGRPEERPSMRDFLELIDRVIALSCPAPAPVRVRREWFRPFVRKALRDLRPRVAAFFNPDTRLVLALILIGLVGTKIYQAGGGAFRPQSVKESSKKQDLKPHRPFIPGKLRTGSIDDE